MDDADDVDRSERAGARTFESPTPSKSHSDDDGDNVTGWTSTRPVDASNDAGSCAMPGGNYGLGIGRNFPPPTVAAVIDPIVVAPVAASAVVVGSAAAVVDAVVASTAGETVDPKTMTTTSVVDNRSR